MDRLRVKRAKAVWQVWYVDAMLEDPSGRENVRYEVKVTKRPIPNVPDIPELHCEITDPKTEEHWLLDPTSKALPDTRRKKCMSSGENRAEKT